jgi:hypothetical protein
LIAVFERPRNSRASPADLTREDANLLAYALVLHRVRDGRKITEDHLRMLASALGVRGTRVSARVAELLGFPAVEPAHYALFLQAADREAREPGISKYALSDALKVDERTIGRWRGMKEYTDRVEFVRASEGGHSGIIASKRRLQKIIKLAEAEKISDHEATLRVEAEERRGAKAADSPGKK